MKKIVLAFICGSMALAVAGVICAQAQEEPAALERPARQYTAEALRDPFLNPFAAKEVALGAAKKGAQSKALPSLVVQGVIWGGRLPQAIINNRVVKEGDNIEGVEIIKINQDGVLASYGAAPFNLSSPEQADTTKQEGSQTNQYEGGSDEEESY